MKCPRLDPQQTKEIHHLCSQGYTHESIARLFNCNIGRVRYIAGPSALRGQPVPIALPDTAAAILRKRNPKHKLNTELVQRIRALHQSGHTQREIAKLIGVSQTNVCCTLRGRIHRDVPHVQQRQEAA